MQDDIFLLKSERELFGKAAVAVAEAVQPTAEAIVVELKHVAPLTEPVKKAPVIKYKGNNKNGYVILVHYPALEWMHDAHMAALENILKRKNIETADAAIVNVAAYSGVAYEEIIAQLKPRKLLLMGKEALPAGMAQIVLNQLHQLADCTALYTYSFGEMMDNNENKKIFWEQMKAL